MAAKGKSGAVAKGTGFWQAPQSGYTPETCQLLKVMMEESKLTNFQQRHLMDSVKRGDALPSRCSPSSSQKPTPKRVSTFCLPPILGPRPHLRPAEVCQANEAYSRDQFKPRPCRECRGPAPRMDAGTGRCSLKQTPKLVKGSHPNPQNEHGTKEEETGCPKEIYWGALPSPIPLPSSLSFILGGGLLPHLSSYKMALPCVRRHFGPAPCPVGAQHRALPSSASQRCRGPGSPAPPPDLSSCWDPAGDTEKEKERLQDIFTNGKEAIEKRKKKQSVRQAKLLPLDPEPDRFEELVKEVRERQEFLAEMQALGQGKQYRGIILTEISQKLREMEDIDQKRNDELQKALAKASP